MTVALDRCSTPIGPCVCHLTHEHGVLRNKGRRALSVAHTCTVPRETRAGFFRVTACTRAFLEKYQRPVRTATERAHPALPRQSFHLCTCLAAPPCVTHGSAQQTQAAHDADVQSTVLRAKQSKAFYPVIVCTVLWRRMLKSDTDFPSRSHRVIIVNCYTKTTTHHSNVSQN